MTENEIDVGQIKDADRNVINGLLDDYRKHLNEEMKKIYQYQVIEVLNKSIKYTKNSIKPLQEALEKVETASIASENETPSDYLEKMNEYLNYCKDFYNDFFGENSLVQNFTEKQKKVLI